MYTLSFPDLSSTTFRVRFQMQVGKLLLATIRQSLKEDEIQNFDKRLEKFHLSTVLGPNVRVSAFTATITARNLGTFDELNIFSICIIFNN